MHPIIESIIHAQWFGKGKADVVTMRKMQFQRAIFGHIIVLVVTAVRSLGVRVEMLFNNLY